MRIKTSYLSISFSLTIIIIILTYSSPLRLKSHTIVRIVLA